ncbi:MAG: TetR family transcriptional regulator [Acidimicrobiales bacterium]
MADASFLMAPVSVLDATAPDEARRARKKRQTRDALIDAALELFEAKGYEHTTVHEITEAVDVAERTFFRYFASKEDVALYFVRRELDDFTTALTARPQRERARVAVRKAFRTTLERLVADSYEINGEPRSLVVMRLIDSTPALLATSLRYIYENSDRAVRVLADREGVDPETDRRPWLLISIYAAVLALVHREWRLVGSAGTDELVGVFDAYADEIGPTVTRDWSHTAETTTRPEGPGPGRGRARRP